MSTQATEPPALGSLAEAVARARPGDTIRLQCGTYREQNTLRLGAKGTAKLPIRVESACPERAVLDFAGQPEDQEHSYGIEITGEYWQVVGLEVVHAGSYGFYLTGSRNPLENCASHANRNTGTQLDAGASHNLIVHCDSYRNFDPATRGEDADGFAAKHAIGPGNVFRECRAYQNSDDGWDLWMAPHPIVIEDSIAFRNGFNLWGIQQFQGDGNGFKLGGNYVDAAHIVRRNIAIENPLDGFGQNHNLGALTLEDNVSIRCGRGFSLPESPRKDRHVLRRNVSFGSQNVLEPRMISQDNRWYPEIAGGNPGPPPRPGHRNVPGAGPVPSVQEPPRFTPWPTVLAPPPSPLRVPPPGPPRSSTGASH